jgi:long-chain acyl-CoA synthetase
MACCHLPSTSMAVGAGAVEFVLCHAEVQIAFVEEKKIGEVFSFTVTFYDFSTLVSTVKIIASYKLPLQK